MGGPSDPFTKRAGTGARAMFKKRLVRMAVVWGAVFVPIATLMMLVVRGGNWLLRLAILLVGSIAVTFKDGRALFREWIRPWLAGARGEERVGAILETLPDGHRVLHDVSGGAWNIDHVVIGPAGVCVIETKAWTRRVYLGPGGRLLCGGHDQDKTVKQVMGQVREIKRRLEHVGLKPYVRAFIALTETDLPKGAIRLRYVTVVQADGLVDAVTDGPVRLSAAEVDRATYAIGKDKALPAIRVR